MWATSRLIAVGASPTRTRGRSKRYFPFECGPARV